MLVFDLMLILLIIISITLLSGTKIMCNTKYFQFIISILVISTNLKTIVKGYSLGYISIDILLFLLTLIIICFWVGYRKDKYKYSIHNVEQSDITNIIENYLKNKYIKYKIDYNKIYLNDTNNTIYINDDIDVTLDFKEIKNTSFLNELINEIKLKIKKINKKSFSIQSIFYLVFSLFFLWIRITFLK